ncbi:hypothetical protein NDU88_001938 [Pleurodeles waltl]|uniref:Uncharacterized protein n=1 Tax=Pleurodeles waltl TaxID=8319 RepID=A0AAV7NDY2_PLEWA|nr:hypothetical protein NDU88_001938 [Pleurodeles waltl]
MEGVTIYAPTQINDEFTTYLTSLYGPLQVDTSGKRGDFLTILSQSIFSEKDRDALGARISVEEVKAAIKMLATGQTLGADGMPSEFYKLVCEVLAPRLVEMFAEAYDTMMLPTREAKSKQDDRGGYRFPALVHA